MTTYTKKQLEDMNFKREEAKQSLDRPTCLMNAFHWGRSPQGGGYWYEAMYREGSPGWQDEIRAMIAAWDAEAAQMTDLTKIDKPFGKLDRETQLALFAYSIDGGKIDLKCGDIWGNVQHPSWFPTYTYRAAPQLIPDSLDWSHVADEFICCARQKAGEAWLYSAEPHKSEDRGIWLQTNGDRAARAATFASYKRGTVSWEDSLIWRPGYGPEAS